MSSLPPALSELFHGKTVRTITPLSHGPATQVSEDFWSLPLVVRGISTLEDALAAFSGVERLAGYVTPEGDTIDAEIRLRIETLPPVLIFALARFEFDHARQQRVKICSQFAFPDEVAVNDSLYFLVGAVLHEGDGLRGHYTSVVKHDELYVKFNDKLVTEISQERFQQEAFGAIAGLNAYLLFYAMVGAEVDDRLITEEFPLAFPPELISEIEEDSRAFRIEQFAYERPFADLALQTPDLVCLQEYFFNVFCHSRLAALGPQFVTRFGALVCDDSALGWLSASFDARVAPVFFACPTPEIVQSVSKVVRLVLSHSLPDASFALFRKIAHLLPVLVDRWSAVPEVAELVRRFLFQREECLEMARADGWLQILVGFVNATYAESRSPAFFANLDLRAVFDSIRRLLTKGDRLDGFSAQAELSQAHAQSFRDLLVAAAELGCMDVFGIARLLSRPRIAEIALANADAGNFLTTLEKLTELMTDREVTEEAMKRVSLLRENVRGIVAWIDAPALRTQGIARALLEEISEAAGDSVFEEVRWRLEVPGNHTIPFLQFVLWFVRGFECDGAALMHALDAVLDARLEIANSREIREIYRVFGSRRPMIAEFARIQDLPGDEVFNAIERLLPELAECRKEVVDEVVGSEAWDRVLEPFVNCQEEELGKLFNLVWLFVEHRWKGVDAVLQSVKDVVVPEAGPLTQTAIAFLKRLFLVVRLEFEQERALFTVVLQRLSNHEVCRWAKEIVHTLKKFDENDVAGLGDWRRVALIVQIKSDITDEIAFAFTEQIADSLVETENVPDWAEALQTLLVDTQ
jgi:hypothetical protein